MNLLNEFARPDGLKLVEAFKMCYDGMPMGRTFIDRNDVEDKMLERIDESRRPKPAEGEQLRTTPHWKTYYNGE